MGGTFINRMKGLEPIGEETHYPAPCNSPTYTWAGQLGQLGLQSGRRTGSHQTELGAYVGRSGRALLPEISCWTCVSLFVWQGLFSAIFASPRLQKAFRNIARPSSRKLVASVDLPRGTRNANASKKHTAHSEGRQKQ